MRVVLTGGGTAGHVFPSVAVAERLVDDIGADVLFVGAQGRLDERILAEEGLAHELIPARPFPYALSLEAVTAALALWRSARRCGEILRRFEPDVVFGAGGYVSVAGVLAAARLGIPRVCHVSDAHPDRANRLLGRWATRITTHFEVAAAHFPLAKTQVTGQPVRRAFLHTGREDARAQLGIPADAFVLLVSGGSQGARTLNHATLGALEELLKADGAHVIHQTGALDHDDVAREAADKIGQDARYRCAAFYEAPWLTLAAADVCLTRGGAGSLAEMAVMGLPTIIVPYPYAAAHQKLNAQPPADAGAAIIVDNADLTSEWLIEHVRELMADRERLAAMGQAARDVSRPEAAETVARVIAEVAA